MEIGGSDRSVKAGIIQTIVSLINFKFQTSSVKVKLVCIFCVCAGFIRIFFILLARIEATQLKL